jgi:hypothetical protein
MLEHVVKIGAGVGLPRAQQILLDWFVHLARHAVLWQATGLNACECAHLHTGTGTSRFQRRSRQKCSVCKGRRLEWIAPSSYVACVQNCFHARLHDNSYGPALLLLPANKLAVITMHSTLNQVKMRFVSLRGHDVYLRYCMLISQVLMCGNCGVNMARLSKTIGIIRWSYLHTFTSHLQVKSCWRRSTCSS